MPDLERRQCVAELRTKGNRLEGYGLVFGKLSEDLGDFREIIAPGAVVLADDVLSYWDHDPARLLARTSSGTLELEVDDVGLRYGLELPATDYAANLRALVQRRDVPGSSFTFRTLADSWNFESDPPIRTLDRVMVFEVGPVAMPAYPDTTTALRQMAEARSRNPARGSAGSADARASRLRRLRRLELEIGGPADR